MADILFLNEINAEHAPLVGGKVLGLARLWKTAVPVPDGFCITAAAQREPGRPGIRHDPNLVASVANALDRLGPGPYAVRSSALEEDSETASFAGQHTSILGVSGFENVMTAIDQCWESLHSASAATYRKRAAVRQSEPAMAVLVQLQVAADLAGVLFTVDPTDPIGQALLIESSPGLGVGVVSGRVAPDRYRLDRNTNKVLETVPGPAVTPRISNGEVVGNSEESTGLANAALSELAEFGRLIEREFGKPMDIEWVFGGGRIWIVQARPITTITAREREQVRREEIAALKAKSVPSGTVWSRHNLAEVLPRPTPMTWALTRLLLSGNGGMGLMFRDLGFEPSEAVAEEGIYDLVCGRPYCNLSREPAMYAGSLPLEHSFKELKAQPHTAPYSRARPNWSRANWRFWLLFPYTAVLKPLMLARKLARAQSTIASELERSIFPDFAARAHAALEEPFDSLSNADLMVSFEQWKRWTLVDFARHSLKPTVLAEACISNLERLLTGKLGNAQARVLVTALAGRARIKPEVDVASGLVRLAEGTIALKAFLELFGHRGCGEMELSQGRWQEDPPSLEGTAMQAIRHSAASHTRTSSQVLFEYSPSGMTVRQAKRVAAAATHLLGSMCTYIALRETAKHHLMMGYAVLRKILLEFDRRFELNGGVFFLLPEELSLMTTGQNLAQVIRERRRRRAIALQIELPPVIFSDELEAIGGTASHPDCESWQGVSISAGAGEGAALIVTQPDSAEIPGGDYVLVCPHADPAWIPFFLGAKALVLETGGILSHGAIVARELGLPAVAGIPGICQMVQPGQQLVVNGNTGRVYRK